MSSQPQKIVLLSVLALLSFSTRPLFGQGRIAGTLWAASEVLEAFQTIPLKSIPPGFLRDAQGIAIIPGVVKLGLRRQNVSSGVT